MFALNVFVFEASHEECDVTQFDQITEAVVQRSSVKNIFLKCSQNSQENTWCQSLFFKKVAGLKVAGLRPATLLKNRVLPVELSPPHTRSLLPWLTVPEKCLLTNLKII